MAKIKTKLPIVIDPEIVSGTPVFEGTRVPVKSLFDWLETESLAEFLENFPSVTYKQATTVLEAAQKLILESISPTHENIA